MSFTNQTTNYGLPQWIGTDKPTYLVDQNGAYATIDRELYKANSNASTAVSSAASAVEVAGTAATNAQTAIDSAATANTNANNAVATANTAITNAASATATANSALSHVEDIESVTIDTHTFTSTTYQDFLNTVGSAINNAIANYPIDDYEYVLTIDNHSTDLLEVIFTRCSSVRFNGLHNVSENAIDMIKVDLTGQNSHWNEYNFQTSTLSSKDVDTITNITTIVYARKR